MLVLFVLFVLFVLMLVLTVCIPSVFSINCSFLSIYTALFIFRIISNSAFILKIVFDIYLKKKGEFFSIRTVFLCFYDILNKFLLSSSCSPYLQVSPSSAMDTGHWNAQLCEFCNCFITRKINK